MDLSAEDRALLALHLVPGIGPRLLAALLDRFGSPVGALRASRGELQGVPHLSAKVTDDLQRAWQRGDVDEELALLQQHKVKLLSLASPHYPPALAQIPTPPRLLFVKGQPLPSQDQCIGIVGSRSCTPLGKRSAQRLATDLARAGWTILSGLARGIDGCAHRGALEAGGRTVAVLAGGLARIYPPEHVDLAEQIVAAGALITESCMRMDPLPGLFPARNRIISGLSRAVIVVEADETSGALITARHALEQGREVFTLPGPVDGPTWGGNHLLLRQGARLIRNARDVLEDLGTLPSLVEGASVTDTPKPPPYLDALSRAVWEHLYQSRSVDELADLIDVPVAQLSGTLMKLELENVVRRLPGNVYERCQ